MARLKPLRREEDIKAVPTEEPVTIDLSPDPAPAVADPPELEKKEEPAPHVEEHQEDDVPALKKRLQELENAERMARNHRDQEASRAANLERQARDQEQALARERADRAESDLAYLTETEDRLSRSLEAARKAKRNARAANDFEAEEIADNDIMQAHIELRDVMQTKARFEAHKAAPPAPETRQQQPPQTLEEKLNSIPGITPRQKDWLLRHPEGMGQAMPRVAALHNYAINIEGLAPDSDAYYEFLDRKMGYSKDTPTSAADERDPPPPSSRSIPMGAPVSRDAPTPNGQPVRNQITLTPEEREFAKSLGQSDSEYARNKQLMLNRKATGAIQQ